jgi:hypothetical protein
MTDRWSESRMSETVTSDSGIFLCTTILSTSPFPQECNEWDIVVLEFQTHLCAINLVVSWLMGLKLCYSMLCHGCLAVRSPASSDLCLKLKSLMMSVHYRHGLMTWRLLQVALLLPIGMWTPVVSIETSRGRFTWLWGMPFLTATAGPPFLPGMQSVW